MTTKVAFWFDAPAEYSGGLNYISNLLYAISLVNNKTVSPYVFFSSDISADIETRFSRHAKVVKTRLLQRGTIAWFIHKVLYKVFGSMALVNALLKYHRIDVISHVWFVYKGRAPFRIIGWIPDFQYLHLPELFPTLDPAEETRQNQKIISQSDIVILSSYNALEDFKRIAAPEHQSRGVVLQFVSQPHPAALPNAITLESLERKYGFEEKFFFLPNQFWAHKNHMVVLQAVKQLKDSGINVLVLCTGNTKDYRTNTTKYMESVYGFIKDNGLQDHVKILGHIDYNEVLSLMKNSLAVLNPSRFEGWSSSVEEAKSMGKPVVLSRIGVHVEQNPENGRYFDPDDAIGLSQILADICATPATASRDEAVQKAQDALQKRTLEFGKTYLGLLSSVARIAEPCANPNHGVD